MLLGEKISSLRKRKSISQELLAENSGISLRTIQRIEKGESIPRPYTLKIIADALQVPVEQLNPMEDMQQHTLALSQIRLINLFALAGLILPFSNIMLPLVIWRKNKALPLVNELGRKIISFQILWTFGMLLILLFTPLVQQIFTQSVAIGRLPPTIFLVYFVLLMVNFIMTVRTAIQLKKADADIYPFVPLLF